VVTGSSPSLAFCAIFIVLSVENVNLHICICICTSHCLHIAARCSAWASRRLADLVSDLVFCRVTVGHVTATVRIVRASSYSLLSQTLLVRDRQCCELWREVKLGAMQFGM